MGNRIPAIIPKGWRIVNIAGAIMLHKDLPSGLRIMFSIERRDDGKEEKHMSFSRRDRYPDWEEMRDFLCESDLIDPMLEITMTLPPKNNPEEYVNFHKNCFHWNQKMRGDQ